MADTKDLSNPDNQKEVQDDLYLPSTDVNIFGEEVGASSVPQPTMHEGVDVQSYLDYTGSDINLLTDDAEKIRARNQGWWEQAGAFVNQAVIGEVVGGSIEGLGYLLDVKGMVDIAKGTEEEWGNWLSDVGKGIRETTQEATPIYQEDPGEWNPSDSGWWFGNGVSVASTLSLMIPSGAVLKGITTLGKGLGQAARATSKGRQLMQAGNNLANRARGTGYVAENAAKGVGQAFLSRHAENMMESSGMFEEKYQDLLDRGLTEEQARQRASEGAARVYGLNSAMILQDIAQYTLLHGLKTRIKPNKAGESVEGFLDNLPGGRYTAIAGDMVGEGLEEAYQYVSAEEGKYLADTNAGIREASDFSDRLSAYTSDGEFMTSAFFGALGSGVMQAIGPAYMNLVEGKTGGFNNDIEAQIRNNQAEFSQAQQAISAARDNGLDEQADYLEDLLVVKFTTDKMDRGEEVSHLEAMREFENMSDEDIEAYVKQREQEGIIINPDSIRENASRHRELAEQTSAKYKDLVNKYGKEVAGPATKNFMDSKINTQKSKAKEQELSDFKGNIPQYSEFSPTGQSRIDDQMKKAGLERAQKNLKKLISEFEGDPELSSQYQLALENVNTNLETLNQKIDKDSYKEYDAAEETSDAQLRTGIEPYIDEGAKIVSEQQIANQMAVINNNVYSNKISIATDKAKSEERKSKQQTKADFKNNTAPNNEEGTPLRKGDPVLVHDTPGEVVSTFEKEGKTHYKIKDLTKEGQNVTWDIAEDELDEKVSKRKYREDIADEEREEKNVEQSREEQTRLRKTEQEAERQRTQEQPTDGPPTDRFPPPVGETPDNYDARPPDVPAEDLPTIPSYTEEEAERVQKIEDAKDKSSGEFGGAEDIFTPDNNLSDPSGPASQNSMARISDGLAVTSASINNPESQISKRIAEGTATQNEISEARAWTDWSENRSPIKDGDTYLYFVEAQIDERYLGNLDPDLLLKVRQRETLTESELDKLPIELWVKDYKTKDFVRQNGIPVKTYLRRPSTLTARTFGNSQEALIENRQLLSENRELIYSTYLDGQSATAPIVRQTDGHFQKGQNVDLGDFSTYNNVAEVLNKDAEQVQLSIVDNSGQYTDSNGEPRSSMTGNIGIPENSGGVYASVVTANGRFKPMRLFTDRISEQESEIIYRIYKNMALGETSANVLSEDIKEIIRTSEDPRISEIQNLFSINDVSNAALLNFLVYEGKEKLDGKRESQLWLNNQGKASSLRYSTNGNIRVDDFQDDIKKSQFKNWIQTNRRRQITRGLIDNPSYKKYLIENNIIATTTQILEDGRTLTSPTTIVGEFNSPTQEGEIDHIEDANETTQEERIQDTDTDSGIQPGEIFQRPQVSNQASLPKELGQRGMIRMLDRLKSRFNIDYTVINDPEVSWSGKIDNGIVYINTAYATVDTPFHEFAHPLIETIKRNNIRLYMGLAEELRNSPQGKRIMRRVNRNYTDYTAEQRMDEGIVQALGEFAAGTIVEDKSNFRRFLRQLWTTIQRLMNKMLGRDITVDPKTMSPKTSLGQLSKILADDLVNIDLSGIPMTREQRPDNMTQQEYVDWVDSMAFIFIRSNMSRDISDISGARLSAIPEVIKNLMKATDESDPLHERYQRVLDEITTDGTNLDPQSKLLLAVQRRLKTYGVVPSEEVSEQEADSRLNIRASYEFSSKDKASINTKLMVAMIPKLNSSSKVDNKFGTNKPDYKLSPWTGLPQFNNFTDTWNLLQRNLANVVEKETDDGNIEDLYDVFIKRLEEASLLRPELTSLIESLQKAPEYKRTEFVQVLALAEQNFSSTFFRRLNDNFYFNIGGSDTQSVSQKIIDQWDANYRSALATVMRGKDSGEQYVVIDSNKAKALVDRYDNLVTKIAVSARDSQSVPMELKRELQDLLIDTGLTTSMRTIDKLIYDSKKGTNEIDKFSQIVSGARGNSIRFIYKEADLSLETASQEPILMPADSDVKLALTNEAFVETMADAEAYFQNNLADTTVLGPENKPFWMFSSYNAMYKKVAEWKEDTRGLKRILSAAYNGNSLWGKWLLESQENRENFQILNFMNFKQEFSSDSGNKNTNMGITDLLSDKLNRMLQGYYSLPARADNTTEYQVKGPKAKKSFRVVGNNLELSDASVEIIKDYILDEVSRIKHAKEQIEVLPEDKWIKDYHYKLNENGEKDTSLGNAFKIHLTPSLNYGAENGNIIFDSRGNVRTLTSENWYEGSDLTGVVRQSFEAQHQRDLKKMADHRVITQAKVIDGKLQKGYFNNAIDKKKMDYYKKEAGNEHLGVQAAIMDYTFNGIIANQEWHKLFGGDIASYVSREDFQKRATGPGSTGLMYRIMDDMSPTYNSAVISDIIAPSDLLSKEMIKEIADYTGQTQKSIRKALEGYGNVDRADAQAWITPEQYRDRMRGYGKWTDAHQDAYRRLELNEPLPEDLKMFMQPLKTVHTEMKIEGKNSIFHYNKQSEGVLHPHIAEALGIGHVLDAMRDQNTDHVVVESGKKSGARGITSIMDEEGNIKQSSDIELNPVSLSKRYLFLQQELPTKGMRPSKEGSQIRKNILEGILNDETYTVGGEEMNGDDFRQEIHNAIGSLSDKGLQEVKDYIGWDETSQRYNPDRLRSYLIDAFTKRDADENLITALEQGIPFDAIPQMRISIENQIAAIVNKKAVDLQHDTGGSYIQMSDVGWTTKLTSQQAGGVLWVNEESKSGLKAPRIIDGVFHPGQILLPHKVAKQLNLTNENLQEIMKDISTGVSYRIPNQATSSNDVVEVVGILPPEMGDTVVAYKEITTKFGSDFDIDKLNIMLPNYRIRDGKVDAYKFHNIDTSDESQLEQVYLDRFGYLREALGNSLDTIAPLIAGAKQKDATVWEELVTGYAQQDQLREQVVFILKEESKLSLKAIEWFADSMMTMNVSDLMNIPTLEQFIENNKGASVYAVNSKEAVQNRKLELYKSMLSNKNTYLQMIKPLDSSWLRESIRENSPQKDYSADFEAYSPTTQVEVRKTFTDTKAAVGQVANHSTDHAFSQSADLYLNKKQARGGVQAHYIGIGNSIDTDQGKATYFSSITDEEGSNIMDTLSAFMTANVDAAKDPYITDGNFTLFTNDVALFLIRAGVPRSFIVNFMDQQILRDFARVTAEYDGRTSQKYTIFRDGRSQEVSPIEYVTYTNSKGENQTTDIEAVTDLETIDPRKLMKNLQGESSPQQDKLDTLRLFVEWQAHAEALNESIRASKADVNGVGASVMAATVKENVRQKVLDDGLIGNFERKFQGTFLENFHNNSITATKIMFGSNTFLHQTKAIQELMEDIGKKIGMYPMTSEDIAFTISSEAYAYLMSGTEFALTPDKLKEMFIGKKSLAKGLLTYKNNQNSPIRDNPFIQYLGVKTGQGETQPDFIYGQGSKQLTPEARNEITQAWEDLLTHDDASIRDFANKLGIYAYYGSGFRRNLSSFHELIPVSLNHKLGIPEAIKKLQLDLQKGVHPLAPATDQIFKNLQDDGRIVPSLSLKSPNLRKLADNLPMTKGFGVIPSESKWLQAGKLKDEDGNPVMKPFLNVGERLYEYRGLYTYEHQEGDSVIKKELRAAYVPASTLGLKSGRFRVKEYYKNLSGMASVFPENNIELDENLSDILEGLNPTLKPVDYTDNRESNSSEGDINLPQYIRDRLTEEGFTPDQFEQYVTGAIPYTMNPDEYVESIIDILKCQ